MNKINSQYKGKVASEHQTAKIKSSTVSHVVSKSNLHVSSDIEEARERAAFLTTAKRNASIMFAKYL